ncbi:MAG: DUF1444 family protein [Bacillaceae bacterium]
MRKEPKDFVNALQQFLKEENITFAYNEKENTLRIEDNEVKKGLTLTLGGLVAKWERDGDDVFKQLVHYINHSFQAMKVSIPACLSDNKIYPVIRSTSFPTTTSEGLPLFYEEHTAETRIYYAIDLGDTYRLIDLPFLEERNWDVEQVKKMAIDRIASASVESKKDEVGGNIFYFIRSKDGYDGSQILNKALLLQYAQKSKGEMVVGVPHQDVLIIGDIRNEIGYDVMAQMMMQFFMKGDVPITSLSFVYEDEELEPVFILGKKRKK